MDALVFPLICVVCAALGWAIRTLAADRSILSDVLRYRSLGWPSGVQEDDDMHWRWRSAPAPSKPGTEHLRVHVGAAGPIDSWRRRRR